MSVNNLLQAFRLNFVYAEKYSFPNTWSYYEASIPYSMIRFIQKGRGRFQIDETLYELEEDDIVYIPQGSALSCEASTDDFTFISIRFTAAFPLTDREIWSEILGFDAKVKCHDVQVKYYFNCIIREKGSVSRGKYFMLRGYLELIVGYLLDSSEAFLERPNTTRTIKADNNPDNRVEIVMDYIMNHFDKNIRIEDLGKRVQISSSSLRRLFKQHTGKSPSEFIIELKMVVAAKKILESDERISDIAYQVGIEDPNYFSRIFKKHYGVTPYSYRQLARK
ncbi:AraC family transcriptional regulator [Paenibacillus lutrae]|uniref:AraC family transcriptional regulator n=1 Tax=Paenibacillus lutrae TaxID=2078573 RepID=A0A7X3FJH0_9BACL|nr:AraC family transcriptional regulator [Paenibacillus lutrae]MVP00634.1 AraC family transcriptional regulator [Paenibacillus lutrae]